MKLGIRQKLLLGLFGMVVIVASISLMTMRQIDVLGKSLAVVLKQNYLSVVACQDMKDALGGIDSAVLTSLLGDHDAGVREVKTNTAKFNKALDRELHNITLPGEAERAVRLSRLSADYFGTLSRIMDRSRPVEQRRTLYTTRLLPVFSELLQVNREILEMNQANMISEKTDSHNLSVSARVRVLSIAMVSILLTLALAYQIQRWVLNPLRNLIETTEEIRRGNLEVVLQTAAHDEVGQLSRSFNDMLIALRQHRNSDLANLIRSRKQTDEVFRALPLPVALIDPDKQVSVATEKAKRFFGLTPGVTVGGLPFSWMTELVESSLSSRRPSELAQQAFVQQFVGNKEYFFQPVAIPIISESNDVTGTILMISDVTQLREQQELKRGLVSTVSHQLKTPLTSLRMSVHLMLDEEIGELNRKQSELLLGARDDCERLVEMLDDLLDLNRIASGREQLKPQPISPSVLLREGIEPFLSEARDRKVTLSEVNTDALPEVMADPSAIQHVFANLLSNALRFTMPGGVVKAGATREEAIVRFYVEDTGTGIQSEHMEHLFDQFFRVPGQDVRSGVGLGLAIVKELVEAHGGSVSSKSRPGEGSCFSFTLPVHAQKGVTSGVLLESDRAMSVNTPDPRLC
ncbi:MAG: HAMP domain-containing protein [Chlorobiaceae bacterium]|nr:HAMP domain-containing protein [Chlorobiaceae bacterium]